MPAITPNWAHGLGYDAEAAITVDPAIDAALCGYEYSGLVKLLNIPEHPRFKMSILRETPVSTQFHGGRNVGMLTIFHAASHAIEKAQRQGFAVVDVTNSSTSGRGAYYVEMIAC
jgi:L-2-hydroxycarboxylate dehydrogenase (NAD+)